MVRDLAKEVLAKNIKLEPHKIEELAQSIKHIVGSLTDSDRILSETEDDLNLAKSLEARAKHAKDLAVDKQTLAGKVVDLLNETESVQKLAEEAIAKAATDIDKSEQDLSHIIEVMK